ISVLCICSSLDSYMHIRNSVWQISGDRPQRCWEAMMYSNCSIGTLVGAFEDRPDVVGYRRLDCKRMSCDRCGPKKARRYRRAIAREAEANNLTRFVTLTLDPTCVPSPDESVDYIRQCFNKFRTYLRRSFGTRIEYITVLELQKSGMAHLHVLIDRFIP